MVSFTLDEEFGSFCLNQDSKVSDQESQNQLYFESEKLLDNTYDYSNRNSILIDEEKISPIKTSLVDVHDETANSSVFQDGKIVGGTQSASKAIKSSELRGKENTSLLPKKPSTKVHPVPALPNSSKNTYKENYRGQKDKKSSKEPKIPQEVIEEHVK